MISVRGRRRPRQEPPSVAPPDFSPLPESEIFKQPDETAGPKSPAATSVPKYSKDDLQRIFKAVLETQAPVPASAVSETPRKKLKTRSLDVYHGKSYMDYYNFCQQCEDYFATARATGPTRILFAAFFFWNQITFHWQQYKRRYDADTPVPVM